MINAGVKYRVTGRYMDGQKLIGYHLVGEDGSQSQESKDRVVYLIEKGVIANLRIQMGINGEVIIRGKGINLNKLPVFDEGKQQFRSDSISQEVANGKVNASGADTQCISKMGQYTVVRRIMYKNNCLGYELKDYSGHITRKKRDEVVQLAIQRLISNVAAHKTLIRETGETKIVLRGIGIELRNLPYIIVDDNGSLINPESGHNITVRCKQLSSGGVLKNTETGDIKFFNKGEYAICLPNSSVIILSEDEFNKKYKEVNNMTSALSDYYIRDEKYSIEIFGESIKKITQQLIQEWTIAETK